MSRIPAIFATALALTLFSVGASAGASATLTLKAYTVVERDVVRLADVAEVQSDDEVLRRALEEVPLGEELIARSRVYGRAMIGTYIKQGMANSAAIQWQGAERVTVERRLETHDEQMLVAAAREYLSEVLRQRDPSLTRVEIQIADRLAPLQLPTGSLSVNPRVVRGSVLSKRMCVWLDVAVNGHVRRHLPVWLAVRAYKPVKVAARPLAAQEAIANADFREEERDVTQLGLAMPALGDVTGSRVRRAVLVGAVLLAQDVEAQPAVLRDQEVRVQVASGSVLLETKAVAEQEGRIGERIRLRNPSSNESFLAKVVGSGQAFISDEVISNETGIFTNSPSPRVGEGKGRGVLTPNPRSFPVR